jgi:hypothetical protein
MTIAMIGSVFRLPCDSTGRMAHIRSALRERPPHHCFRQLARKLGFFRSAKARAMKG